MHTFLCFSEMTSSVLCLGGSTLTKSDVRWSNYGMLLSNTPSLCAADRLFSSIVVMKMNILLHFDFESAGQTKIKPYICTLPNPKRHDNIT